MHGSRPQLVLTLDALDPSWVEFHHSPAFAYGDLYLALLQILNRGERGGVMDIELALSRDGLQWQRPFWQPCFLARSAPGQFDSGSLLTTGTPILHGDELRFYYGGYSEGGHRGRRLQLAHRCGLGHPAPGSLCRAAAGGRAGSGHPQANRADADRLAINCRGTESQVRVELLDGEGRRLPGYSADEALAMQGDKIAAPIAWRGGAELPAGVCHLRVHLQNATLYALYIGREDHP